MSISRFSRAARVGTLLFVAWASQLSAEEARVVHPGSRIRVRCKPPPSGLWRKQVIGTFIRSDTTGIELQVEELREFVPRDVIANLDLGLGRRSRGVGAGVGGLLGCASGIILVLATWDEDDNPNDFELEIIEKGDMVAAMGALGFGVGALVGYAIPPGERWTTVQGDWNSATVSPREGGVQFSRSFAF